MKILHLTTQDSGGAGRATLRLHKALLEQNIHSYIFTLHKTSDLSSVQNVDSSKFQMLTSFVRKGYAQLPSFFYKNRQKDVFSSHFALRNPSLIKKIKALNPDIIHLHWMEQGFSISKIF
ncbi:glycosyltransferase [Helicobacter mustelae]|uniref:glycosyltransferase n=1 Tax=Helicobacter mustelae TaxID=217 RepID=UPI000E019F21|nr:glycosyltransferase [Helicobacter mustelae]STP12553.1 glycosyltransferase [Helicobacter mustelae]